MTCHSDSCTRGLFRPRWLHTNCGWIPDVCSDWLRCLKLRPTSVETFSARSTTSTSAASRSACSWWTDAHGQGLPTFRVVPMTARLLQLEMGGGTSVRPPSHHLEHGTTSCPVRLLSSEKCFNRRVNSPWTDLSTVAFARVSGQSRERFMRTTAAKGNNADVYLTRWSLIKRPTGSTCRAQPWIARDTSSKGYSIRCWRRNGTRRWNRCDTT